MRGRLVAILLILFFSCSIQGQDRLHQSKINGILADLKKDLKPRARIAKHLKLIVYYKYAHPSVDSLIETSLAIAEKRNFPFFIARSLKFRAKYNLYVSEVPENIFSDIRRIEEISKTFKNKLLPGWIAQLYAEYYILTGDLSKAERHIDSLEFHIENNVFTDRGTFHTVKGMYHQAKRNYTEALGEYNIALTKKNSGRTFILNNIAKLHLELLNPEKAIQFANESIDLGNLEGNIITRIASKSILGEAALLQFDTVSAINYFSEVQRLRSSPHYGKNYTGIHKLVDIYKVKDVSQMDNLLKDISPYKMMDVYAKLLGEKGLRSLASKDISQARELCLEAHKVSVKRNSYKYASLACDCLVELYEGQDNAVKVAEYLALKIDHQAKLQDEKRIISLARNLATFETEKEKALISQAHEKDQLIMTEKLDKYKLSGILGLMILMIGGIALWQLRKRNRRIASQNKVISKALSEKDILLREIHHRVKNNLQLVSSMLTLQGRSIDDEMALQAITEGKNRVRSMALIHQDLYNKESITGISVSGYLSRLTQELMSSYSIQLNQIDLVTDIQELELDIDTLVPLGLIINELFSNSLKYAFPDDRKGTLLISLKEKSDKLVLIIKDDGIGYDPKHVRDNSFGTTLISALADQLEGVVEIETKDGTHVKISFADYKVMGT